MVKKRPLILGIPADKIKEDLNQTFEEVKGSTAKFKEDLEASGMSSDDIEFCICFKEDDKQNFYNLDLTLKAYEKEEVLLNNELEAKGAKVVRDDAIVGAPIVTPIKESKEL